MTEATVRMGPEDEEAENAEPPPVLEDVRKSSEGKKKRRTRANSKPSTATSTGPKSTATSSDFDTRMQDLESKMEERFTTLMNTFTEGLSRLEERQPDKQTKRHPREERENENGDRHVAEQTQRAGSARHRSDDNDSDSDNSPRHRRGYEDDVLSVNVRQNERDEVLSQTRSSLSDDRISSATNVLVCRKSKDKFSRYLQDTNDGANDKLNEIFGEAANSSDDEVGIVLDQAQVGVLKKSWRSEDPERLTAYKEDTKLSFPVNSKSSDVVRVPALDDLLEPLLRKQNSNFRAWGKSRHLASASMKSIENVAYQGQIAARMGILSIAYIQQALAKLLNDLKEDPVNVDRSIQSVRDIFDMSTKSLDQMGRAGAFHHIIRRKAAISDSGLSSVKDVQNKVASLPLSGDGVCGKGLEDKLKQRKEQREQLTDLLPEYNSRGNGNKRRSSYQDYGSRWHSNAKRSRTDSSYGQRSAGGLSGFRRQGNQGQRNKSDDSKSGRSWSGYRIPKRK